MKRSIKAYVIAAVMTFALSVIAGSLNIALAQGTKASVSGKVVDSQSLPLIGVVVKDKNSNSHAMTDENGAYAISLPASTKGYDLQFILLGMKTVEKHVSDASRKLDVTMLDDDETLNEVIVTGIRDVKRELMTGSSTVVTANDLRDQGITSIDRVLEGKVAGMNVATLSGAPGARAKITIRGENNLSGNSEPLWIVDGLPMTSGVPTSNTGDYTNTIMQDGVGNIMPEDIETISILKDASAAAIYGARAANGVIVITTKKGFRSKTMINYSGTVDVSTAPRNKLPFMNSDEKLQYEQSIIDNFGIDYSYLTGQGGYLQKRLSDGFITPEEYNSSIEKLRGNNTDWFKVIFRNSFSQSHNLSVRGGTDEITYYTSATYRKENGILLSNGYQYAGILAKIDYRPFKNFIAAVSIQANTRKNEDNASALDPFKYAMFANPYETPYDDDGSLAADLSYLSNNYTTERASGYIYDKLNIIKELTDTRMVQEGSDVDVTLNLHYDIIPGLIAESIMKKSASYNTTTTEISPGTYTSWVNERFARAAYQNYGLLPDSYDNGELSEGSGKSNSWTMRNKIDWSHVFNEDHLFSVLLAQEVMSRSFNNNGHTIPIFYGDYRITGIPTFDRNATYSEMYSAIQNMYATSEGQDRSVSFIGAMSYSYKDRYVLNFNYRMDGADVIGNQNRFTPLGSVGYRYNMHKEKWFQNPVVTELSLRGSYGYTGNIDRTAYPFSTITLSGNKYLGNRVVESFTYPNPSVSWERKLDRNLGFDMTLFKNRINLTVDYYSNRTDDILENLEIPESTGRKQVKANGGIVKNTGLETYVNVRWLSTKDWTFSTSVNFSMNKNVIVKSFYNYNSYQEAIKSNVTRGGVINIIGTATGSIYGWKFAGVNPVTGNPQYYLTEEGMRAYSKFIDQWDQMSDSKKKEYLGQIVSPTEVPDKVDFVRGSDANPDFLLPSIQYLGSINPKVVGGFNTYLKFRNIEFTTSWSYKLGHLVPNFNDYQNAPNYEADSRRAALGYSSDLKVSGTNREAKYINYWQFAGDITDVPRFTTATNDLWASACVDYNYTKGDYLRLSNASISYRIPTAALKKLGGMSNCSISVNARNLLTVTRYKGLDVGTGGAFTYPVARMYNLKLTIGF